MSVAGWGRTIGLEDWFLPSNSRAKIGRLMALVLPNATCYQVLLLLHLSCNVHGAANELSNPHKVVLDTNVLRVVLRHVSAYSRCSNGEDGIAFSQSFSNTLQDWWLMLIDDVWCWLMLIDVQWCWLMFNDVDWCWLMLIDGDWCWLMLVDVDWCWLMLIDVDWCWLMLIDVDWCWLMLFDVGWCWLVLFDVDRCWSMLIDVDWRWLMLIDVDRCWSMLIDVDWCWVMLTDVYWWWLMLVDDDWCWLLLMLVDVDWCSLMFIDDDWCWWMMIGVDWCWLMLVDVDWGWLMLIDVDWGWLMWFVVDWLWSMLIDVDRCWLMLIDVDWLWSMLIDVDWCWMMLIVVDWLWSMLIDVDWCWMMLIVADWCWSMLIDVDWGWLLLIDFDRCWSMFIAVDWCWLLLIDFDRCWSMFIDAEWCWLLLIDFDRCWSMLIDVDWFWLMLIDFDRCWLMLIDFDWCWLTLIDVDWCWYIFLPDPSPAVFVPPFPGGNFHTSINPLEVIAGVPTRRPLGFIALLSPGIVFLSCSAAVWWGENDYMSYVYWGIFIFTLYSYMGISVGSPNLSFHCRGIPSELWWMGWSRNKHHSARCKRQTQCTNFSSSQIFSAPLHSEISEIGDWKTRPSCHFRVHMSTTVITNYHALVPPKKCPGAYSTRWKPAHKRLRLWSHWCPWSASRSTADGCPCPKPGLKETSAKTITEKGQSMFKWANYLHTGPLSIAMLVDQRVEKASQRPQEMTNLKQQQTGHDRMINRFWRASKQLEDKRRCLQIPNWSCISARIRQRLWSSLAKLQRFQINCTPYIHWTSHRTKDGNVKAAVSV